MSLKHFLKQANHIFLEICWSHWRRFGAYADGPVNHCSTDPEALILLTCSVGHKDLRLLEIMAQWIRFYENLINVGRLQTMLGLIRPFSPPPYRHEQILQAVLKEALPENVRKPWRSIQDIVYSNSQGIDYVGSIKHIADRKKLDSHEKIIRNNLQLALRYLFGPLLLADIYYFFDVISHQKQHLPLLKATSSSHLARRFGCNRSSVHRVLRALEDGLFIQKISELGHESIYEINSNHWLRPLHYETDKAYIDWRQILAATMQWQDLERRLETLKDNAAEKNPLIRVWLYQVWDRFQAFGKTAQIPTPYPPIPQGSVETIPTDHIMNGIITCLEMTQTYISSSSS